MIPPTSEQAESLAHLFRSNSHHVKNFTDWISKNIDESYRLMIDPSVDTERLLRITGETGALVFLKNTIEKSTK